MDRSPPGTPETSRPVAAIPPAYRTVEDGRRRVIVREDSLEVARESGFVRGERRGTERGVEGGRTIHPLVDVPPHGTWLWKRCRRGGAAAHLLRDRYLLAGRLQGKAARAKPAFVLHYPSSTQTATAMHHYDW